MAVKTAPPPRHVQSHFLNRELWLLEFNRRVLAQAEDAAVPLLERLRSSASSRPTSTSSSRSGVAGLKEQIKMGIPGAGPDGTTPREVFAGGQPQRARPGRATSTGCSTTRSCPTLAARGHRVPAPRASHRRAARVGPRLLPARDDAGADADRARPGAPVPARLQQEPQLRRRAGGAGRVRPRRRASRSCRRRASLPRDHQAAGRARRTGTGRRSSSSPRSCTSTCDELFPGMHVLGCYQFRVTRNSDLFVDEEEVKDLRTRAPGRAAAAALRRRGAPRGRRRLPAADDRVPAAAVRPRRGRTSTR